MRQPKKTETRNLTKRKKTDLDKGKKSKNNIILIGMPGSGKSTIGVQLAKWLGYKFLDSDLVMQEVMDKPLGDILNELGDKRFIEFEDKTNCAINTERTVIATGGSAVYGASAMAHFKDMGHIVYLKTDVKVLNGRLGDLSVRGVVSNGKSTIEEIYAERQELYEKYAEVTVVMNKDESYNSARRVYEVCKDLIDN